MARLSGEIEWASDRLFGRLKIQSIYNLFGVEWIRSHSRDQLAFVVLGRKIGLKRKYRPPRDTGMPFLEHGKITAPRFSIAFLQKTVMRLIWLSRRIKIDRLSFSGIIGLGDPANTGMAYGLLHSFQYMLPDKITIDMQPNFIEKKLEGKAKVTVRFCFMALLAFLVKVGFDYIRIRKSN